VSTTDSHVVVVGAGIGGLASALLLARSGASVTLVEKHRSSAVGAGILLQPNGLAVLHGLGLGRQLQRSGHRIAASRVRAADGRVITELVTPDFGHGLDHVLAIRRATLHQLLETAVAAERGITVRRGVEVTGAASTGSVELAEHDHVGTLSGDLVVGADGVHSTVRTGDGFDATVTATGQRYVRGLVPADPADADELEGEFWTPLGVFGGARVDASTTYFYASARAPEVARAVDAADLAALRRAWAAQLPAAGPVLERVRDAGDLLVNDVVRVDCRRWYDGRLVLLGDAAHAMAPTLGQGANSALVDAAVLAQELSRPQPVPSALERYAARRQAPVRRVQDRADRVARLAHLRSTVLRRGRNRAMRGLGRLPGADERLVRAAQQEDPGRLFRAVRTLSDPAGAAPEQGG
jgi:2-polyprenyl-6-methoxyphenol hydroxylase-like FAD-dependent oxidoreductase